MHRLTDMLPDDVYDKPQHYTGAVDAPLRRALGSARGNPEAMVTIHRSVPPGVREIHPGDWVSPSRAYAAGNNLHPTDPSKDFPVISARVPAKHLWTQGDDLQEWGYHGPKLVV
jgi:hypothetical protein